MNMDHMFIMRLAALLFGGGIASCLFPGKSDVYKRQGAGGHSVVVGPVPYRIVLADMILFRLVFGGHRFSIVWRCV